MASGGADGKTHGAEPAMGTSGKIAIVILTILVVCLAAACAILALLLADPTLLEGIGIYLDKTETNGKGLGTPAPVVSDCRNRKSTLNITACIEFYQRNTDYTEESGQRILQKELKSKCICKICPEYPLPTSASGGSCPTASELCPTQDSKMKEISAKCPEQKCPTLPSFTTSCPPCQKTDDKCPTAAEQLCPTASPFPTVNDSVCPTADDLCQTPLQKPCPTVTECNCPTADELCPSATPCPTTADSNCPTAQEVCPVTTANCPNNTQPKCPAAEKSCPTIAQPTCPPPVACPVCPIKTTKLPFLPINCPAISCPECPNIALPECPFNKCPTCPTIESPTDSKTESTSTESMTSPMSTAMPEVISTNVPPTCPTAEELCPTQLVIPETNDADSGDHIQDNYDQNSDAILDMDDVCTLPSCLSDAGRILSAMDAPTDPCQDFHKFSCGGMKRQNNKGKLDAIDSYFNEIEKENVEQIRRILEKGIERNTEKSAERKVKEYFSSCVSRSERVADQLLALKHGLKKLGGWIRNVHKIDFSDWNPRKYDLDASLRAAHFELMSKPFVEVDVQSELGLDGNPAAHLVVSAYDVQPCSKYGKRFRAYLRELAEALNPDSYVDTFVQGVSYVYSELCKVQTLEIDAYESSASALELAMPISELNVSVPWIKWLSFLHPTYSVDWKTTVYLSPGTLIKLQMVGDIMPRLLKRNVRDYMAYKYIEDNMLAMPRTIQDVFIKYNNGSTQQRKCGLDIRKGSYVCYHIPIERSWRNCIQFPLQESMPLAVTSEVDGAFSALGNKELGKIRDHIKAFLIHRTSTLTWIPEALQHQFEMQIEGIMTTITEPKWVKHHHRLSLFYDKLSINKSEPFLTNYLRSRQFTQGQKSLYLNMPTKEKFRNLRHSFLLNIKKNQTRVIIDTPIVAMRQPFYKTRGLEYLNYGGIGHIISYEFGQAAFVMSDRLIAENIDDDFACLSKHANISETAKLHEALTGIMLDILGVSWSYEAYAEAVKSGDAHAVFLPGVPYTPDQVFFINTAQVWCQIDSKNAEKRVNNIMSETPQFLAAFQCPVNTPLNTGHACGLR